jgi:hypothetical protein
MEALGADELVVMGMEGSANKVGVGIVTGRLEGSRPVPLFWLISLP